jgi:hypothetical protein
MPRVVHFELEADNVERASAFYSAVFGWTIKKWDGPVDYWMVMTGNPEERGIDGGLMQRRQGEEMPRAYVNTIDVPDLDAFVASTLEHGGKLVVPRMTIPGVGYMAYCEDTEGNMFSIMQMDTSAQAETPASS